MVGPHLIIELMTLLKRIATSVVLFVFFFVVLYFAISIVGGFMSGFTHGLMSNTNGQNPHDGSGGQIGTDFVNHHILAITLSLLVVSLVLSLALSFSGVLSWCRKPSQPPKT